MVSKEEQARALLHGDTWDLAQKYAGGDLDRLRSLLTVTREDLKAYIAKHGYPKGWWRFEVDRQDGLYTVEKDKKWIVYFQERGQLDYEYPERFETKAAAVDFVLDRIYLRKEPTGDEGAGE